MNKPTSALIAGLLVITLSSICTASISLQEGIYTDAETGIKVEVKNDDVPGITFIRAGPPLFRGLWINTWTLDGYRVRHPQLQAIDLSIDAHSLNIDRGENNLYRKTLNDLGNNRVELTYKYGSPFGFSFRQFSIVINKSNGFLEQFNFEDSSPWKYFSFWPTVGNIVLFKLRLHTGPFRRYKEVIKCYKLFSDL